MMLHKIIAALYYLLYYYILLYYLASGHTTEILIAYVIHNDLFLVSFKAKNALDSWMWMLWLCISPLQTKVHYFWALTRIYFLLDKLKGVRL